MIHPKRKLSPDTFSSEDMSAIFGGASGGLFFINNKQSRTQTIMNQDSCLLESDFKYKEHMENTTRS